ncbi:CPBP family intramembrane glutamic endopeptidase [Aquiflexum gelatinilyticum]|uniref:CPBP family intramembrane glutamic endopeptidase n=1 Tax=Aquiflexum gelatinilyticum TaxID=2961943 RepID=UPI002169FA7E|nr:CPBP family intramembrane glutamic endopeptidase [Aquiflexum gelatinilyticum]MCS4433710.1 CPBP family intramembrane metalloprotease [Aquiflexum gelatinilyticum]
MDIYKTQVPITSKSNWLLSIVVMVLVTFGVLILLQGLGLLLLPFLFGIPLEELTALFTAESEHPNGRMAFLFVQGLGGGLGFLVSGLLISKVIDKADIGWQQQMSRFKFMGFALTLVIMVGSVLFNSLLIDWNAKIVLPEFLSELEQMMKSKEDELMALTKYLTDFENVGEFLMGILVIGVLAGIGEEFLFRGVLQPKLHLFTGNAHVAIWLSAFIFSAIHFQFYGFFPRMMLGAVFGYLYLYSGSLVYPIVGHILNNTFTVVLVYLNKLGQVEFNIEETDQVSLPIAILGLVILVVGFKVFKDKTQHIKTDG